jgi:hypothetical protein
MECSYKRDKVPVGSSRVGVQIHHISGYGAPRLCAEGVLDASAIGALQITNRPVPITHRGLCRNETDSPEPLLTAVSIMSTATL